MISFVDIIGRRRGEQMFTIIIGVVLFVLAGRDHGKNEPNFYLVSEFYLVYKYITTRSQTPRSIHF